MYAVRREAGQPVTSSRAQPIAAPFLAADIGGTHARVGLVSGRSADGGIMLAAYRKYRCDEFASLHDILHDFIGQHTNAPVRHGALACAGYVVDNEVINANLPWKVAIDALRRDLQLDELAVINDFKAVAYATQYLAPDTCPILHKPASGTASGTRVVVGPGTGLGSAVLLADATRTRVLATEAGQIALAPGSAAEMEILRVLARSGSYVPCERVLSGPGLLNLYRALCTLDDATPVLDRPEAITTAALDGNDPLARRTLEVFCAWLGGFVGDLTMLYGASGGVWLAGGILPGIRNFLARSAFVERFLDKGRMRPFLERVPIRLMEHGQLGVIGAAGWYLDQATCAVTAPTQAATAGGKPGARQ